MVMFLPWCKGSKQWCLVRKSVSLPFCWMGDQRREGSSYVQQTAFFSNCQAGLMLQQFSLNCRNGWGAINLRLRTPWHQSAQKADIPLAVLSAMLEEPRGAAGPGGMFGADFIIFDFIFFSFWLMFSRWSLCSKLIAHGSTSLGNRTLLPCNHFLSNVSD